MSLQYGFGFRIYSYQRHNRCGGLLELQPLDYGFRDAGCRFRVSDLFDPRFLDEQLGSAVEAIEYLRGGGNGLLTSIPCTFVELTFAIASRQLWGRLPEA